MLKAHTRRDCKVSKDQAILNEARVRLIAAFIVFNDQTITGVWAVTVLLHALLILKVNPKAKVRFVATETAGSGREGIDRADRRGPSIGKLDKGMDEAAQRCCESPACGADRATVALLKATSQFG
jgi:hypothetical protein